MKLLKVNMQERSYPIVITNDFNSINEFYKNRNKCVVVADENVERLHILELKGAIKDYFGEVLVCTVKPGEFSKSLETLKELYYFFLNNSICREDVVMSFGGGVIGDLAGFAAATYMRGIQLIHVPTSLLAQVDSSVGGKTAVNLLKAKNIIGAFYQPSLVFVNYNVLNTLPKSEIKNALVEMLVHAIIKDEKLFYYIEENLEKILELEPDIMEELIYWNCVIKKSVIERDEREQGERAILNFGHTFGHAIESAMEYRYKHGECVALGILGACYISEKLKFCDSSVTERIYNLLKRMKVLINIHDCDKAKVFRFLLHDKKATGGKINFILPVVIGEVVKCEIGDFSLIIDAFEKIQNIEENSNLYTVVKQNCKIT